VITAAHCLTRSTTVYVHLGVHTLDKLNETGRLMLKTNVFHKHENFNPSTLQHDLALIKLPYQILFTKYIQPVRLPVNLLGTLDGINTIVTGWGKTNDNGELSNILQKEFVTVIGNSVCSRFYDDSIYSTDICTMGKHKESVCDGDSGGPLCILNTNILIGVVSYYHGTSCESGFPSGYMRVTSYLNWISKTMNIL
jgi:elastase-2